MDEFANLQDLVSVKNKTEEELQEINKKEIEKSKVSKKMKIKLLIRKNTVNKNKYYIKKLWSPSSKHLYI